MFLILSNIRIDKKKYANFEKLKENANWCDSSYDITKNNIFELILLKLNPPNAI